MCLLMSYQHLGTPGHTWATDVPAYTAGWASVTVCRLGPQLVDRSLYASWSRVHAVLSCDLGKKLNMLNCLRSLTGNLLSYVVKTGGTTTASYISVSLTEIDRYMVNINSL